MVGRDTPPVRQVVVCAWSSSYECGVTSLYFGTTHACTPRVFEGCNVLVLLSSNDEETSVTVDCPGH